MIPLPYINKGKTGCNTVHFSNGSHILSRHTLFNSTSEETLKNVNASIKSLFTQQFTNNSNISLGASL
jgi:hypothetical protein